MVGPLDRKLLRDAGKIKGQIVSVSVVMGCGLAMMIMARSLIYSLESTRDRYYESNRFADVFCDLKRAPNAVRARISEIPGVAAADTRVTGKITLDLPDTPEPADGTILSLPEDRPQQLNQLFLRTGRLPEIGSHDEVVVGEAFANVHGFQPGNTIDAIIHGARQRLKITGIALSPEYVFEARPGETLPDNKRFGVFWMNERALADAMQLNGAFNNVIAKVAPGQDTAPVMAALDRLLAPYGGLVAYDRRDHPSAVRLHDELNVLHSLSYAFPIVFLSIAAFMVSAVLSRLVRLQREQIAQLKALGYSSRDVGIHYLKFAFIIVALGTLIGGVAGCILGSNVVQIYHRFFRFPSLTFHLDWGAAVWGVLVSAGASFIGVLGSVRMAARLPPAEAMRPEPPADFEPSFLERVGFAKFVGPAFRMALRNIERRPVQAAFTALGLSLAAGIPVVPGAMRDGINYLINFQWQMAQRQDVTITLIEPGSASAIDDMAHLPGVVSVEGFRNVPARLRFGPHERRLGVIGLARDARLNRVLDSQNRPIALPPDGVLLSAKLAELLGAKPGDTLTLEIEEGRRPVVDVTIQGVVTDYTGIGAYMDIEALRRIMQEGGTVSGAHLVVDKNHWVEFLEKVKDKAPRIANLGIKDSARDSFRKTTAESIGLVQGLYFSFSIVVAFGVVYNSARIALSERSRDLATLRVVGFSHREVALVLIGELALLTLVALPIGAGIGSLLATGIVHAASTETVRLPLVLTLRTYSTAAMIVVISAAVSFAVVSSRIRHLDLLGVLKARE